MEDVKKLISKIDELLGKMESFNKPYIVATGLKCDRKDIKPGSLIPLPTHLSRDNSKSIIPRVIAGVIAAVLIGALTWIGDLLYEAPSPTQQKIIYQIEHHLQKVDWANYYKRHPQMNL